MVHFRRVIYNNDTKELDPSDTHMKLFGNIPLKIFQGRPALPYSNGMEFLALPDDQIIIDGTSYPIYL